MAAAVAAYQENEQFREFTDKTCQKAEEFWNGFKQHFNPEEMRRRHESKMHAWGMRPTESQQRSTTTRDDLRRSPSEKGQARKSEPSSSLVVHTDAEVAEGSRDGLRHRKGQAETLDGSRDNKTTTSSLIEVDDEEPVIYKSPSQPPVFFEAEDRDSGVKTPVSDEYEDISSIAHSKTSADDVESLHNSVFEDDPLHYNPFADPRPSPLRQDSPPHPLRSNPIEPSDVTTPVLSRTNSSIATEDLQQGDDTHSIASFSDAYTDVEEDDMPHSAEREDADDGENLYVDVLTPTSEENDDMMSEASFESGWSEVDSAVSRGSSF